MISDCRQAEIIKIDSVSVYQHQQRIHLTRPLQRHFESPAEVGRFKINTYYVAKTKRHAENGAVIYALYLSDMNQVKTELVEDISAIHFQAHPRVINISFTAVSPPLSKEWYAAA